MKKIVSIICFFVVAFGAFAQSSTNEQETVSALKARIVKLEAQIKDDVEIIRAIRAENRALKREIRKMRKASIVKQDEPTKEVVRNRQSLSERYKKTIEESSRPKVEAIEEKEPLRDAKDSSIWDHMFPF